MQNNRQVGSAHENFVALELEKRGYRILKKNFRCRVGEIDLVALHRGYLVFIEVKYRKSKLSGYAAEAVTRKKQQVISRVADYYIHRYCTKFPSCRFDVAAVDGEILTVYEHAFEYIPRGGSI